MDMDYPDRDRAEHAETIRAVRDALSRHLSPEDCEVSAAQWAAMDGQRHTRDALFNSIVEFTRQVAKSHDLDTLTKQQIRGQLFARLLPTDKAMLSEADRSDRQI